METTLKSFIRERISYKSALTRFRSYLETYDRTKIKIRLSKIVPIFEVFNAVQTAIEEHMEDANFEAEREEFETRLVLRMQPKNL